MKIGSENRTKLILAVALGGVAALSVGHALFSGSGSPEAATPVPTVAPAGQASRPAARHLAGKGTTPRHAVVRLDPTLDLKLLQETEGNKYEGSGRNIFVNQAEVIPAPIAPPIRDTGPVAPPPPPQPPPILLKFFGFANRPGEPKRIFLSQGEDVFIAGEGDIVDRRYRILHIGPNSVEIEDVLNNNRQSIPLTQG